MVNCHTRLHDAITGCLNLCLTWKHLNWYLNSVILEPQICAFLTPSFHSDSLKFLNLALLFLLTWIPHDCHLENPQKENLGLITF